MSTEDNSTTTANTTAASPEKSLRSKSRLFWFCQFTAGLCFITAVILLAVGTSNIVSLQIDKSANVSHTARVILKRREITAMACLIMGGVCVLASLGIICYTCLHIRRKINTVVKNVQELQAELGAADPPPAYEDVVEDSPQEVTNGSPV